MAATRSRSFDATAAPAAWPASTALKDVPRKRRRERRSSPGLRGRSANDGFMVNLDGAMGAGVVAWSAPLGSDGPGPPSWFGDSLGLTTGDAPIRPLAPHRLLVHGPTQVLASPPPTTLRAPLGPVASTRV